MTKQELIDSVYKNYSQDLGLTKRATAKIIDGVFGELGDYFIKAKMTRKSTPRFTFPGFGTFSKKKRAARHVRHPQTGKACTVPEIETIQFAIGRELRSLMNGE